MDKPSNRCGKCCFCGLCSTSGSCQYYSPADDSEFEEPSSRLSEKSKAEYYSAWIEYMSDFN